MVFGVGTMLLQPLGCCLFPLGTIVALVGTFLGLGAGLAALRIASRANGSGAATASLGVALAGVNAAIDLLWLASGVCLGGIWTSALLAR